MIETRNQGDLIKLLIEMARGPPHIEGLCKNEYLFFFWNKLLDVDKSFTVMTDAEIAQDLKRMAGLLIFNFIKYSFLQRILFL